MAPISSFITMKRIFGPQSLNRFNLFSSMTVSGSPNPSFSTGQALQAIRETAAKTLPSGYGFEFSGISLQEQESGTTTVYIFILSLVFVYFLLSALYESYLLPFAVIFSLPIGLAGEMLFIKLFGIDKNIYVQIAMIMLIGLLAKNAILIVEFAIERRRNGMGLVDSAIEGARVRLRPILMTSFAFICGLVPLMFASGAGANGNRSLGTSAVGGMLVGTLLGVFVTPVLYILFQGLQERLSGPARPLDADDEDDAPQPATGGPITPTPTDGPDAPAPTRGPRLTGPVSAVLAGILVISLFASCKVTKPYSSPTGIADSAYYGQPATDTNTIAHLPWQSLFSDTVLQRLITEGLTNNLDLQTAVEKIRSSDAALRQAKAAFLPSLDATVQAGEQKYSSGQTYGISVSPAPYFEAYLSSTWTADIWGQLKSSKKAALATLLQTVAAKQATQTQLIASIAVDYYRLLAYDKEIEITRQTVENRKKDVAIMTKLKEGDVVTSADVVESEANLHSAEVSLYDYLLSVRETENALSILLGRSPGPIERTTLDAQQPIDSLQTGLPSQLLRNRPDVIEAEYAFRKAFEVTNVARTYFYPSLSITAQGGLYALGVKDFFNAGSLFGSVIGGLTQPIFAQGQNKARLRQDQAAQAQALNSYRSTLLNAGAEVSNYLYSYQLAVKKQEVRSLQIASLQKAVDYTQKLLKFTSNTNYNDVLTAEQNLLSAQLSGVADRLQQLEAVIHLYVALGGGWK
jgi:NodT family efflux transporter outer membrane factor (OMF) lipoprotein